ncbi:tetraacyldisaccharide 4'-kinase [Rickettsiales bacterium]|nr:tetraacyldisaccharide 4'-kinase [Rickettsiales bacterium]
MQFKSPDFWCKKSYLSLLLIPLSWIFSSISLLRKIIVKPVKVDIPVICIGNINVGGTGKTPVAVELCKFLQARGKKVAFLSRGYGGNLYGPVLVNNKKHKASDVGDEPLLLSQYAPTYIAKHRPDGAIYARKNGADIIIMDDGLQNPHLKKDFSILVIDGQVGLGNGRILPAGPLRESLSSALNKTDALVIIGHDKHNISSFVKAPIIKSEIKPLEVKLSAKKYVAFAGIGRPKKFFDTLDSMNLKIVATKEFADHKPYSESDILKIKELAKEKSAGIITTQKDYLRIDVKLRDDIEFLPVQILWNEEEISDIMHNYV